MAYIYMDESGDLGFSGNGGSNYFIITFLVAKHEKDLELIMKSTRKWAITKKSKIYGTFFHAHKVSKNVVKRVLDLTSRREIFSVAILINKQNIPTKYKNNLHEFYNYLVGELLELCQKRGLLNVGEIHSIT